MNEPIRMSFVVACSVSRAWAVWTAEISRWWPRSHSVSGDADLSVIIEGRPGGRIFERTPDGKEADWGEILVWEPPRRLVYLWHLRADHADATEVEIEFSPEDNRSTRVEIEHRGWERLGARGQGRRDANLEGWSGLLPHFVMACSPVNRTIE